MSVLHYISSETREAGSRTNFTHKMTIPSGHDRIGIVSVSFPKSFYLVKEGSNTFMLDSTTFTIPPGNYDISSFCEAVNGLIAPSTVAFSYITGKMTFTSSATDLIFPATSRLWIIMGFEANSTNSFSGGYVTSPHVCRLQALSQVYITSDLARDNSAIRYANLLGTIFVNQVPDFAYVVWNNPQIEKTSTELTFKSHPRDRDLQLTPYFTFTDQDDNILDLNGQDIELILVTYRDIMPESAEYFKDYLRLVISKIQSDRVNN